MILYGQWRVFYLGFARRGWTAEAQRYALAITGESVQGPTGGRREWNCWI
jgi:hypothetical protein